MKLWFTLLPVKDFVAWLHNRSYSHVPHTYELFVRIEFETCLFEDVTNQLTLLVLKLNLGQTMSITCPWRLWFLVSPGYQQPRCCLCTIERFLLPIGKNLNNLHHHSVKKWWQHHQMEKFSALLTLCDYRWIPLKNPVMQSFDVSFDMCLKKWLSKRSRCQWFETPWHLLWCHCNVICIQFYALSRI